MAAATAKQQTSKPSLAEWVDCVFSVVLYMSASAGMSIANKMAIGALRLPMLLVGIQCSAVCVMLIPFYKYVNLGSWSDKARWFPASLFFVGMLGTSMIAFKYCSLGTIVVVRMCSPLLGLAIESFFKAARFIPTIHTYLSLGVTLLGVLCYGIFQKGLHAEYLGLMFLLINMLLATFDRLLQRYLLAESPVDISNEGLMLYNNGVSAITMPIFMFFAGEWEKAPKAFEGLNESGWIYVVFSCMCGAMISYTSFRVQRRISATSFLVCINMNKFLVIAFGILVLHEVYKAGAALGCAIALFGGAYYSWDRTFASKSKITSDEQDQQQHTSSKIERYKDLESEEEANSDNHEKQGLLDAEPSAEGNDDGQREYREAIAAAKAAIAPTINAAAALAKSLGVESGDDDSESSFLKTTTEVSVIPEEDI